MRLTYRLLNVFARAGDPFSGNPLCVVEGAQDLTDDQMQGLARQFNLSETTFLVAPADGADAGVRIFTPNYEMAFAGHPTLGTAHAVRALGLGGDALALSMPAGTIPVSADGDTWTLTANRGVVHAEYQVDEIASCVGLEPQDLVGPVQQVSTGSAQVIARAATVDAVRRAVGDAALMRQFAGMGTRGGETLVYLWCETAEGQIEARALFTQGGGSDRGPGDRVGLLEPRCLAGRPGTLRHAGWSARARRSADRPPCGSTWTTRGPSGSVAWSTRSARDRSSCESTQSGAALRRPVEGG